RPSWRRCCRRRRGRWTAESLDVFLRLLDGARNTPALGLRDRPGLDKLDQVADLALILLVVRVVLDAPVEELVEAAVADAADDRDGHRLVHLGGGHHALNHAANAAVVSSLGLVCGSHG